jgi:hypothetical protein
VDDRLEELAGSIKELQSNVEGFAKAYEERLEEEAAR